MRIGCRLLAASVGLILITTVTGCGVPVDRAPSALPRKGIPFGLLQPSARSTTTTSVASPVEVPVRIFLVASTGRLIAVTRHVPATQDSLAAVLTVLFRGPLDTEATLGVVTAIPSQIPVLGAAIAGDEVATVNLGTSFAQLVGQAQIQAVAQIVFTAAALPGVSGVTFELGGHAVNVPVASGAQVPIANPADFASLAPPSSVTAGG